MYTQEAEALTGRGVPQSSSIKHVPIGREKGPGKEIRHGHRFSTEPPGYRKDGWCCAETSRDSQPAQ